MFGNWPVAIVSYNHGQQGIYKAIQTVGSSEFMDILNNYDGRLFGFASRNFYGEFLAACRVMHDADKYFGSLNYGKPLLFDSIKLSQSLSTSLLLEHADLTKEELRTYNPALQSNVLFSRRAIPAGYTLRLPQGRFPNLVDFIAKLRTNEPVRSKPAVEVASNTTPKTKKAISAATPATYVVRHGDTLFGISKKFDLSVAEIRKLNGMNHSHIFPGQKLVIGHN